METRSERREKRRNARRKMRVTGTSVRLLNSIIVAKAQALKNER